MAPSAYSPRKSLIGSTVAALIIAAGVGLGWLYFHRADLNPLSEDAILTANLVHVAASVPGRIVTIAVAENGSVRQGELVFAVDDEPYRLAAQKAAADLAVAEAALETQRRTISAEKSNAQIAGEQVTRARTNLALAEQTLARLSALLPKGYVTAQQVDDARTARDDARVSLTQALKQAEAADVLVSTLDGAKALVDARRAALAIAQRNLASTQVRAPHDGRVVGLTVATGEVVAPGQSLFTLVVTQAWYASASFLETELDRIAVGDCARIYVLANRSIPIEGRVEGIGWGVTSEDLLNIPRALPYLPKSLNWVRISQRFPVRIRLIDPPADLMRVGASAVAVVRHGDRC